MNNGEFRQLFGAYVKERRLKCGYTQEQLALEIGVATSTYENIELGKSSPKLETITKLSLTLELQDIYDKIKTFWCIVHQNPPQDK